MSNREDLRRRLQEATIGVGDAAEHMLPDIQTATEHTLEQKCFIRLYSSYLSVLRIAGEAIDCCDGD